MAETRLSFYTRRLSEERARALRETMPSVQAVHRKLAKLYAQRISELERSAERHQLEAVQSSPTSTERQPSTALGTWVMRQARSASPLATIQCSPPSAMPVVKTTSRT